MTRLSIAAKKLEDIKALSHQQLSGLFTDKEICGSSGISLAGKLAAKNAFFRNAGIISPDSRYRQIEIIKAPSGRPFIKILYAPLAKKMQGIKTSLSISHTKGQAVAVCVIYGFKNLNENIS